MEFNKNKLNFKTGFTLAEILIVLTIIGVIASLTIPNLLYTIQRDQFTAAYKKTYSNLVQAISSVKEDNGGTLIGISGNSDTFIPLLSSKFILSRKCGWADNQKYCWHKFNSYYTLIGNPISTENLGFGFVTADGTLISGFVASTTCNLYGNPGLCGHFVVDTNGFKGPNTVGKDIHRFRMYTDRVTPSGHTSAWDCNVIGGCCNRNNTAKFDYDGDGCGFEILNGTYDWEK